MASTVTRAEGATREIRLESDTTLAQGVIAAENIIPEPTASSFTESLSKLNKLLKLQPNWDSYDAPPPAEKAVRQAGNFLRIVYDYFGKATNIKVQPSAIAALADGGTHLSWNRPHAEIEVEFSAEGILSFLYVEKEDGEDKSYIEEGEAPWWRALELIKKVLLH